MQRNNKPKRKVRKNKSLRSSIVQFNKIPSHEVTEAKFRYSSSISGAATTGTVNTFINLASILTTLPDWTDMVAVFKRVCIPMVKIRITPFDINQKGVLAVGFDPDGAGTAPGTFNKVAELKQFTEVRAVDSVKMLSVINPNLTANRLPFQLVDTGNIATLSSFKLYQDSVTANASNILYIYTLTFYTYWTYRG